MNSGCSYRERISIYLRLIGEVLILRTYESEFAGSMVNKGYDYEGWEVWVL